MLDETAATAEPDDDLDDAPEQDGTARRVSFFEASNVLDAGVQDHAAWDEIEEADAAVCARVWEIFAKDSTARGFDARSQRSILATNAMARRRAAGGDMPGNRFRTNKAELHGPAERKQEARMAEANTKTAVLSGRLESVLDVCREAEAKGERLTNLQIAERANLDGKSDASRGSNASGAVCELRAMGLLPKRPAGASRGPLPGTTARKAKAETSTPAAAPLTGKTKSGRAGGTASAKARAAKVEVSAPAVALVPMGLGAMLNELVAKRDALVAAAAKLDVAIEALRAAS